VEVIKIGVRYDNEYIKRPLAVGEYTPEMLVELDTCSENPLSFVKHVVIVHPDKGKIPFNPYPFQMEVLKTIINNRFVIILCARQAGKCVQGGSLIRIRNKKTGQIEDITIEDFFLQIKK